MRAFTAGALSGLRIIEFAGIGPGPFCAMMLADHGAEVIRIERPGIPLDPRDALLRNRKSVILDLKSPADIAEARALCETADGLIEGFRPGVMERLGIGPEVLLTDNPKLVYGRVTGWGQTGPLAALAGHDINYIALSGVLHTIGSADAAPVVPVNYLGDFGGGGMLLAFGMLAALLAVKGGACGQVVDAAMTDGSALLASMSWALLESGENVDRPGVNLLDGGAHFYDTYECADGKWVSIGAIEPQFYAILREKLGIADDPSFHNPTDKGRWPSLKSRMSGIFKTKTRAQWCEIFTDTDACFAPVLSMREAAEHPHNVSRETFLALGGATQPAPAPRLSVTPAPFPRPAPAAGANDGKLLRGARQ